MGHYEPLKSGADPLPPQTMVTFTLDGKQITAGENESLWQIAKQYGNTLPHLCYADEPGYRSDGNCRACMVEIEGERVLAASCIRTPAEGMVVNTQTNRAVASRKMVMELLLADQPEQSVARDQSSQLWSMASLQGLSESRFPKVNIDAVPLLDESHVAMRVTWTPVSIAICAFVPVAKCRLTMLLACQVGGAMRASPSTRLTLWVTVPALPAVNAFRPAPLEH